MSNNQPQGASIEAAPCPFCGAASPRVFNSPDEHGHDSFGVQCSGSDCAICGPERGSAAEGVAAWNRRTPAADVVAGELPKTWEQRLVAKFGKIPRGGHLDREDAMQGEIADLRAKIAEYEIDDAAHHRVHDKHGARIIELEDHLAAKGQGEPVAEVTEGPTVGMGIPTRDIRFFDSRAKVGDKLYLAAPASAQPTDPLQAQRARMAERFAKRPRTAATADFDLPAPNDEIGAQPDQRESAAEGGNAK